MRAIFVSGIVILTWIAFAPSSLAAPKKQAKPTAPALPQTCAVDSDCTGPRVCRRGKCIKLAKPKAPALPQTCAVASDCTAPWVCRRGKCIKLAKPKTPALPQTCVVDSDCTGRRVCHLAKCTKLSQDLALLEVLVVTPGEDAMLTVDDGSPVAIPWEGIVPVGPHQLRIWAPGYETIFMEGNTVAGVRTQLTFSLTPSATSVPMIPTENSAETPDSTSDSTFNSKSDSPSVATSDRGSAVAGRDILNASDADGPSKFLYLAALFHGSAGVAIWGKNTVKKQITVLGGMEFGMRIDNRKVAFELGLSAGYGEFLVNGIQGAAVDYSRWNMLLLGVVPRFSFPLRDSGWFAGFELEVGYVLSTLHYGYAALRGHLAYAFQPWLELRLNLLGADWMQELEAKAAFVAYNGNAALVVRFP